MTCSGLEVYHLILWCGHVQLPMALVSLYLLMGGNQRRENPQETLGDTGRTSTQAPRGQYPDLRTESRYLGHLALFTFMKRIPGVLVHILCLACLNQTLACLPP